MDQRDLDALQIVRDALDEDAGERERFVTQRCSGDEQLHDRVQAMLCGISLDDIAATAPDTSDSRIAGGQTSDALIGTRLGTFRVLERIGRGGMGIVYRAEREGADFAQQVAIKLIRRGFDFDDVQARFLRERRILARLSHPNLARFIDGGVAPDGRPWFALEYVSGQPVTAWCDAQRLDIRSRIKLFLAVCAAVQYAHTQLIVHRDLKPANVLIDDTGAVRLLDFGVAGLIAGEGDDDAALTTIGVHHAITPEYAAPEQFSGEVAGVSCDIYALGVIAYELISGVLPYTVVRHDLAAAWQIARETPPQLLVSAITRSGVQSTGRAESDGRLAARAVGIRGYRAQVRGDLSRIIDKVLAKQPSQRYATAQAFADDLQRWLDGSPVDVSGRRIGYRAVKFVRRNRSMVAVIALLVLSIVAGVAGIGWQLQQTRREADAAIALKDRLTGMLYRFDSQAYGAAAPTMDELVQSGLEQVAELEPGTQLRRELAAEVIDMLTRLGDAERAYTIALRELGPDPASDARSDTVRLRLTSVWADALLNKDRAQQALPQLSQVINSVINVPPLLLAGALTTEAELENSSPLPNEAKETAKRALSILEPNLAPGDYRIATARFALAAALATLRDVRGGHTQTERVLRDLPAADSRLRVYALTKAAMRRSGLGDFEGAEAAYAEGQAMLQRLGVEAPKYFDDAMRAVNFFDLGRLDSANALIEPIHAANNNPASRYRWEPWNTDWIGGEIALAQNRFDDAATLFDEGARAVEAHPWNFLETSTYVRSLQAYALIRGGHVESASSILAATYPGIVAKPSYATAMRTAVRGALLGAQDRPQEAVVTLDAALSELAAAHRFPIGVREQMRETRDALRFRLWKMQAQLAAGEPEAAAATARVAQQLGLSTLGAQHPFMRELAELRGKRPRP